MHINPFQTVTKLTRIDTKLTFTLQTLENTYIYSMYSLFDVDKDTYIYSMFNVDQDAN